VDARREFEAIDASFIALTIEVGFGARFSREFLRSSAPARASVDHSGA
jgi:hypothetical protein